MVGMLFTVRSVPNLLVGFVASAMMNQLDRRVLMRLTVCARPTQRYQRGVRNMHEINSTAAMQNSPGL